NRTWRPTLSIIGAEGLPQGAQAGNVLRPNTTLKLSFRTPPNCELDIASKRLKTILEADPPYGAKINFELEPNAPGWNAPALAPWLEAATNEASNQYFGKPAAYMGEGGSIPFMGMLGEKFPKAQFLITGVLGPHSNAHGPNEFLHIEYAKKLTACIAHIVKSM
ncbi:MAG: peptidase M20, partial [Gammaproteobacteria bacterium]